MTAQARVTNAEAHTAYFVEKLGSLNKTTKANFDELTKLRVAAHKAEGKAASDAHTIAQLRFKVAQPHPDTWIVARLREEVLAAKRKERADAIHLGRVERDMRAALDKVYDERAAQVAKLDKWLQSANAKADERGGKIKELEADAKSTAAARAEADKAELERIAAAELACATRHKEDKYAIDKAYYAAGATRAAALAKAKVDERTIERLHDTVEQLREAETAAKAKATSDAGTIAELLQQIVANTQREAQYQRVMTALSSLPPLPTGVGTNPPPLFAPSPLRPSPNPQLLAQIAAQQQQRAMRQIASAKAPALAQRAAVTPLTPGEMERRRVHYAAVGVVVGQEMARVGAVGAPVAAVTAPVVLGSTAQLAPAPVSQAAEAMPEKKKEEIEEVSGYNI